MKQIKLKRENETEDPNKKSLLICENGDVAMLSNIDEKE